MSALSDRATVLATRGLAKRYGNVTVLRDVDFEVRGGEIHALLGANGAGKSTLCKIVSGLTPASDGTMTFDGRPFAPETKRDAEAAGVEIVQQELNLIGNLSVAENLFLGRLPSVGGVVRRRRLRDQAREALDRFGLGDIATDAKVSSLGVGRQQMVEIAAALSRDCGLLILDEPTAALSGGETERLFEELDRLRKRGVAIVYISHRLGEVSRMADRVTVLRDGRHVTTVDANTVTTDDMVDLMSGTATGSAAAHVSHATDDVAMRVEGISAGPVRDVSFEVRRGEVFGVTGLVGSGRTELLRAIFGADVAGAGGVELFPVAKEAGASTGPRRFRHPAEATRAGIAMVTEDRKENGLLLRQPVRVNATLASMRRRFSRFGVIRRRAEVDAAEAMRRELDIRGEGIEQPVGRLSGGNQQKVAVAKWLVRGAEVYLLDEPTRGIDVAARRRIYQVIDRLAAGGGAVVVVSSDAEELYEICDTILAMSAGRVAGVVRRGETGEEDRPWDEGRLMRASFAGYAT